MLGGVWGLDLVSSNGVSFVVKVDAVLITYRIVASILRNYSFQILGRYLFQKAEKMMSLLEKLVQCLKL